MAEILNLRQARRRRARDTARAEADSNAARHGRSKAERAAETARTEAGRRHLDGHRLDPTGPDAGDD